MKKILFALSLTSFSSVSGPIWTNAEIDLVFGGYPDGSIAFLPKEGTVNPANCQWSQVYVMPPDHDTKAALSILLAAKMSERRVYFSVRDNICHAPPQTGASNPSPVIQRVAVR